MTQPTAGNSFPAQVLAACCPEAQADGVPCTSLGRACAECERAVASRRSASRPHRPAEPPADQEDPVDPVDYWAV